MSNVLFNISYCNKASNRIVFKQKGISVFLWIILSHKVSRHFPTCTHLHSNIRELQESSVYSLYTGRYTPSLVENLMFCGRRNKFWIISSRLCPYSDFSKHLRKSCTVQCEPNPGKSTYTDLQSACIYNKKK